MLPDYLNSYNPLKERLTGKNEEADQGKVQLALRKILDGKAGSPEFGMVSGSAEEKALGMVGGNTGRFAGNYIVKNYDKLDPMVKKMVPLYGKDIVKTEGALEKQKEMPVLPRVVESARRRQSERKARAEQPKASFLNPDMENVGFQEGGMVPVDGEGNVPPEAVAGDVVNGAPMGMVDVPNGGGPVDDGVPTELPEGTVVINAAAIRLHGTETIDNLINAAVNELLSEGVQISMEDPNPEDDVPVAISNGEYIIPPEVAEKIGYKKLEDMNERGRAYLQKQQAQEKQQAEAQQQPSQPSQQPPEGFMGPPMPQEQAGSPQAPVQSEQQAMAMMGMMGGGRVPYASGIAAVAAPKVGLIETLQNFMSQFGSNVSDMFGGEVKPTAEGFPKQLSGQGVLTDAPTKPKSLIPEKPKKDFAAPFVPGNMDPAYSDETMPDPGNIFKARKTQARAQGGFVGEYNYAQPQQATMGTPFPNAVDSNPQQSQSFLQPNDAKKKSRVGLKNGDTVNPDLELATGFQKAVREAYLPVSEPEPTSKPETTTDKDSALEAAHYTGSVKSYPTGSDYSTYKRVGEAYVGDVYDWKRNFNAKKRKLLAEPFVTSYYEKMVATPTAEEKVRFAREPFADATEEAKKEALTAIGIAASIFEGDLGFSKEKIVELLKKTGQVETNYTTKIQGKGGPKEPARSYWQIEPDTALGLLHDSSAYLGKKFEEAFKGIIPKEKREEFSGTKAVGDYLRSLTEDQLQTLILEDKNLGATLAMHKYLVAIQNESDMAEKTTRGAEAPEMKNTQSFINIPEDQPLPSETGLQEGGKVSNRFKLFEPKDLTEKALRGYQDLEDKLFKYADDVRKLSFGMQLKDAYPEDSQSRKNIEDDFAFIIDDMADQVIRGQAHINTNNYTKFIPENNDESVYGGASDLRGVSKLKKYRKQELVDYLHEMYQSRVYDVVNSGLTEEEVMASSPKSIRELKDSVPGDRHIDAGHALEHRARKKYKDAKDPFLVDPNKTKPKTKPMPNPRQKSIITKPNFLNI